MATVEDVGWPQDMGFFGTYPERRHYARMLGDGTTCVVRVSAAHQREAPVFLRVYGLVLDDDPLPEGEAACAALWARLAATERATGVSYGEVAFELAEAEVCGDDG